MYEEPLIGASNDLAHRYNYRHEIPPYRPKIAPELRYTPDICVFMDMDGVLAHYVPRDYQEIDGQPPRFMKLNSHYFIKRSLDMSARFLAYGLLDEPTIDIYVCSHIVENPDTPLGHEHLSDKDCWLWQHLSRLMVIHDPIIGTESKVAMCEDTLGRDLGPTDVLIDDYNANLDDWKKAGGTSVKWLNGLNSHGTGGHMSLDKHRQSVDDMITSMIRCVAWRCVQERS